jgi:hypothetical protein
MENERSNVARSVRQPARCGRNAMQNELALEVRCAQ